MSNGLSYAFTLAAMFAAVVVIVADRPEKRPGNLAPIQLITAVGAWSLIVINSVVAAVACAIGSVALAIAPVATTVCAAIHFARGAGGGRSTRSMPDSVDVVIAEIRDLLGGARRLGLNEIDAMLAGDGPYIGVTVPARGRVVVRVHESLVPWIEHHRRRSAATIGSFIRLAMCIFLLLTRSILVNEKWISFLGILGLLIVFEFINLLFHPYVEKITTPS